MAVLNGGILGSVSGKVAGVVAGQWKNKNYIRKHAIPANPNTIAQQTQRGKFQAAVAFAKLIVGSVLNPFVDPFQKAMSGYNWFIKQNITKFTGSPVPAGLQVTSGKLFFEGVNEPTKSGTNMIITFGTGNGVNGLATDKINMFVVEQDAEDNIIKTYHLGTPVARSTGTATIAIGATTVNRYMRVYAWAAQYDTNATLVSVSNSDQNAATFEP